MFLLKNLPTKKTMDEYKHMYPDLEIKTMLLSLKLLKIASVLIKDLDEYFSSENLSLAKFLALIVIERENKDYLLISEVADNMGVSKKNTSRLLESLSKEGLISITPCQRDKRIKKISLLKKGSVKLKKVLPGYYLLLNKFFSSVSPTEKVVAEKILSSLL